MPLTVNTRFHSGPTLTADLIQRYARIMNDLLNTYFYTLRNAPDSLYIMMATMELESSYHILHNGNTTASHISTGFINNNLARFTSRGVGKSYWNDTTIAAAKADSNKYNNILEGLSAQALMGSLGMYQVKNTRISNDLMDQRHYRDIATSNTLLVNPGQSPSAIFTNDDAGARKSMILGCMDMEWKYSTFLRTNSPALSIQKAVGAYVGQENAADVLGTTPSMRINDIFYGSASKTRALRTARTFSTNRVFTRPILNASTGGQTETKTQSVASTDNLPTNSNGCNRA